MDWQGPKEAAEGNQYMLAGSWKGNCKLRQENFTVAFKMKQTLNTCMMSLPPIKETESPFFHAFVLVNQ